MRLNLKLVLILVIVILTYTLIYLNLIFNRKSLRKLSNVISIAVVVCGINRVDESLVMIKSSLIFSTTDYSLNFVIVAEESLHQIIAEKLKNLENFGNFTHEIVNLKFPSENREIWEKLFKPCASQRLFLPSLLPHIDSLIYVDCDVLFLSSPALLHAHFKAFNAVHLSALSSESENPQTGWYTRFARHPYVQPHGINSGVMLMNLTRMRAVKFEAEIHPIYEKYKNQLAWGDQDLLNIYFSHHPNEMQLMKCEFNYRPDHCMYTSNCELNDDGVKVVHGNRGYFHKDGKQRIFREIYKAIEEVRKVF